MIHLKEPNEISILLSNKRTELCNVTSIYFTQRDVALAIGVSQQSYLFAETWGRIGRQNARKFDAWLALSRDEAIKKLKTIRNGNDKPRKGGKRK